MKLYYTIRTAGDEIYVESGEVAAMPPFQVGQLIKVNHGDEEASRCGTSQMRIAEVEWSLYTTEHLEIEDKDCGKNPEPQLCMSILIEKD